MRLLYMDNFRGFKNTFLELKDVNFFVGDNSSGKTSVISLIALLSSSNPFNLNNNLFQLGAFDDIANKEYRDFFIVGYLDTKRNYMLLLKFIQGEKGKAEISEIITYKKVYDKVSNEIIKLKIENKKIRESFIYDEKQVYRYQIKKITDPYLLLREGLKLINTKKTELNKKTKQNFYGFFNPRKIYSFYSFIPPIRSNPKRIYEMTNYNQTNDDTPYILNDICKNNKKIKKEIELFAKKANLFKTLNLKNFSQNDLSPFSIEVKLDKNVGRNIYYLGYGVSQSLPILTQIIFESKKYHTGDLVHLIQQPEVHLHPKAQVIIGDLIFYEVSKNRNINFVVETHSDYIIDRFRLAQKKSKQKVLSQVVFFQRQKTKNTLNTINIEDDGKYSTNQPKQFRDFFIKEAMHLLEI